MDAQQILSQEIKIIEASFDPVRHSKCHITNILHNLCKLLMVSKSSNQKLGTKCFGKLDKFFSCEKIQARLSFAGLLVVVGR